MLNVYFTKEIRNTKYYDDIHVSKYLPEKGAITRCENARNKISAGLFKAYVGKELVKKSVVKYLLIGGDVEVFVLKKLQRNDGVVNWSLQFGNFLSKEAYTIILIRREMRWF